MATESPEVLPMTSKQLRLVRLFAIELSEVTGFSNKQAYDMALRLWRIVRKNI